MKIRNKIFFSLSAVAAIMAAIGITVFYRISSDNLRAEIFNHLLTAAGSRADHLATYLDEHSISALTIASTQAVKESIKTYGTPDYEENRKRLMNDMTYLIRQKPEHFEAVSLIDSRGLVILSTNKSFEGMDKSSDEFISRAMTGIFTTDVYNISGQDHPHVSVFSPVYDEQSLIGFIEVDLNANQLFSILEDRRGMGETGELYIVNRDHKMISHSRFKEGVVLSQEVDTQNSRECFDDLDNFLLKSGEVTLHQEWLRAFEDYRGVRVFGTHAYVSAMQWCLLAEMDEKEVLGSLNKIFNASLYVGIIILLVVIMVVAFLSRTLTSPIKKLQKEMEVVAAGDFGYRVSKKSNDEIGQLSLSFEKMIAAVKRSREEVDKRVERQTREIVDSEKELKRQQEAILNILEDVDEEKNMVSGEKEKISAILYGIGDGVFVVDKNREIIVFNPVAEDISGFSAKEALGKTYKDILKFVDEKDSSKYSDFLEEAIISKEMKKIPENYLLITKSKRSIPVYAKAAPIIGKAGGVSGCVVVFRDITQEREIDKAKSEFVSLASHQLRTPLSAINWYAEMLLAGDTGKLKKQQESYLKEIYKSNQRMVSLVNALLNVSRLELGTFIIEPKPLNIITVADDAIKETRPFVARKKIKFTKKYDGALPLLNLDRKLIFMIFQNLLSNAVKYTPANGDVGIEIKKIKESVKISVKDNGIGIPKSQQKHIFKKLFRADNAWVIGEEGTGLGLYIVKSILDKAGGRVYFNSIEGKGSTFIVEIPLSGMKRKEGLKELG